MMFDNISLNDLKNLKDIKIKCTDKQLLIVAESFIHEYGLRKMRRAKGWKNAIIV